MTKKTVFCDKCGTEVKYPLIVKYKLQTIEIKWGKSYFNEMDLCQNCIDSLEKWFNKREGEEYEERQASAKNCKECKYFTDSDEVHGYTPCGSCGADFHNFEPKQKQDEKSCNNCGKKALIEPNKFCEDFDVCHIGRRNGVCYSEWIPTQDEKCENCAKEISAECVVDGCEFEPKQADDTGIDGGNIKVEIPKNATNGDVIKALFPRAKIWIENHPEMQPDVMRFDVDDNETLECFNLDWWNAPWKGQKNET